MIPGFAVLAILCALIAMNTNNPAVSGPMGVLATLFAAGALAAVWLGRRKR